MSRSFRLGIDVNGQRITGVASPSAPTDAANRAYVDAALAGLAWKQPVRAASTAAVTLSAIVTGATLDGVTLQAGDRVLLKDQTAGAENGIYTVSASAPVRATDADTTGELVNASVFVESGTVNADRNYTQTADRPTVGTTALTWALFGSGSTTVAGDGLASSGSTLSVKPKPSGGIQVDSTGVSIDPSFSGLAKRYAATLPSGATSTAITHNLGTKDLSVDVYDISGGAGTEYPVDIDYILTSVNVVTFLTPTAVLTGQYRVVFTG